MSTRTHDPDLPTAATARGRTAAAVGAADCGRACGLPSCGPCVAELTTPAETLGRLRAAIEVEAEPLVTLTHLLHLCRDQHPLLWATLSGPIPGPGAGAAPERSAAGMSAGIAAVLPAPGVATHLDAPVRRALAEALRGEDTVAPVVVAHRLAQLIDDRYGHTFASSFRARSPYQPAVGDPIPLGNPDLRAVLDMHPTAPPWRLANRLDETRHIRLAGEWATQFRIVFDYDLFDTLAGLVTADTVLATCHPNRTLAEFALPADRRRPAFGIAPVDPTAQAARLDELIGRACTAGASIIVLPELCTDEQTARALHGWVERPEGPRLLVAGSFHHEAVGAGRSNTALAWVRGHDQPLLQDKHSPADYPVIEDIQPDGWPQLRIYVTADGWHLVIAICRDLLNPHAVHALTEAGANLVCVPAMSETLVAFGGPAAQLVGSNQALVVIANNPADWTSEHPGSSRPARALLGHPGLGQQTRLVQSGGPVAGVGLLTVRSAHISWLDASPANLPNPAGATSFDLAIGEPPGWAVALAKRVAEPVSTMTDDRPVTLRRAAVLILLCDGDDGPAVVLTERSADLTDYPSQYVFPGGSTDPNDNGPVATVLREASEEVGLDPRTVHILGMLPAIGLPDTGFLVTPVLAWTATPPRNEHRNQAEVAATYTVPLADLSETLEAMTDHESTPAPLWASVGRMTGDLLRLLLL